MPFVIFAQFLNNLIQYSKYYNQKNEQKMQEIGLIDIITAKTTPVKVSVFEQKSQIFAFLI